MHKIAIIGGGAAGIMAAASILENNNKAIKIDLFEKNLTLGVKVKISGGGRCNVTTGINDMNLLLRKYVRGGKFLRPAFSAFSPNKIIEWFEKKGVPLKTEADKRVFPVSNNGADIIKVFEKIFTDPRIKVHFQEPILSVDYRKCFILKTKLAEYSYDKLIITTGGNAYAKTGSSGDGYTFATKLGHTITNLGPSLNSFVVKQNWVKELSGISLPKALLKASLKDGTKVAITGPLLFTHFGITGPAVFALAANIAYEEININKSFPIQLIPDAEFNFDYINKRLRERLEKNGAKKLQRILQEFIPARLAIRIIEQTQIQNKNAAAVNKVERLNLINMLTGELRLDLITRRPGDEFVTAGGVNLGEIDNKTMESKLLPGLFFAGEILDVDGLTGGFNLQSAWATGRMAGKSAVNT